MKKYCLYCGKELPELALRSRRRYCSDAHKMRSYRERRKVKRNFTRAAK